MDTNFYNNGYGYPYPPQYPYGSYEAGFGYSPQMQQNVQMPTNQNACTPEEIQAMKNASPRQSALNLTIEDIDVTRSRCTHKENGADLVKLVEDGTGDVYCPLCQARWNPEPATKEEVANDVRKVISHMQNSKWTGELPNGVVREYMPMIPLLEKLADIYEYGAKAFQKFYNQRGFMNAGDANLFAQYNSLFPGYYMPQQAYYQPQPAGYYQQPGQQTAPAQPATNVNPMQAPMYGAPGYNTQFGNQANVMMGGTYYANQPPVNPYTAPAAPQPAQQQPYSPVYGNAQQQPAQNQPQQNQPATDTTNTKVNL